MRYRLGLTVGCSVIAISLSPFERKSRLDEIIRVIGWPKNLISNSLEVSAADTLESKGWTVQFLPSRVPN